MQSIKYQNPEMLSAKMNSLEIKHLDSKTATDPFIMAKFPQSFGAQQNEDSLVADGCDAKIIGLECQTGPGEFYGMSCQNSCHNGIIGSH